MRESQLEARLVEKLEAAGCVVRKVQWLCRRGAPDRVVFAPQGRVVWVELKRPGGVAAAHQQREHARLTAMGQDVRVLDSTDAVDALVGELAAC